MNQNQKILLLVVMIVFAAVLIYPPFEIVGRNGRVLTNGYAWIFDLPRLGRFLGAVNIPQLLIQWAGVLIIGGMLFFVLQDKGPAVRNKKIESRNDKTLEGIGGWLAFLIFSLLVLSPLFSLLPLGGIYGEERLYPRLLNDPDWNALKDKFYVVIFIAVILYLSAGWALLRRRYPDAVTFAITTLWVGGPFASAVLALWAFSGDWGKVASALFISIPHAVIWTAYLQNSIRVKNTYSGGINLTPPQSSVSSQKPKPKPSKFVNEKPIVTQFNNEIQPTENNTNEQVFFDSKNQHAPKMLSNDALYEMAWKETETDKGDRGLLAKAYAVCDGEKEKTRAYYIRERVKFLQGIQKKRLDEYEERKTEEENKRKNIQRTIQTLRGYWNRGEIVTCRKEARLILGNMGFVVRYLNQPNEKNLTPLMSAVIEGDKNKVELLLLAGADPMVESTFGETATERASKLKHEDIAQLIDDYSQDRKKFIKARRQESDHSIKIQSYGERSRKHKSSNRVTLIVIILILIGIFVGINNSGEPDSAEEEFNRGNMYYSGEGVEQNFVEALRWYSKAAEQGNAIAQSNVGVMYHFGQGIEVNYAEAVKWYRKAVEQGDADAQNSLGFMYSFGKGVEKDLAEAVKWYRKAAEQGHATGQFNLGIMYADGEGVEQNYVEALRWYRKAADQGEASAQVNLGNMYAHGKGVEQNYVEALRWYRKAAERGYALGQKNLGGMYDFGRGVEQNKTEAVKWYRKASEQGNAAAQNDLGVIYELGEGFDVNYAEAVKWYRKAADADNKTAQSNLALMYAKGRGVPQDDVKAAELFFSAANKGDIYSQFILGLMTSKGRGVPKDIEQAISLYRQAAEQDHLIAQLYLAISYQDGLGVAKDKKESDKWFEAARKYKHVKLADNKRNVINDGVESPPLRDDDAFDWLRESIDGEIGIIYHRLSLMFRLGRGVIQDANEAEMWSRKAAKQGYKAQK